MILNRFRIRPLKKLDQYLYCIVADPEDFEPDPNDFEPDPDPTSKKSRNHKRMWIWIQILLFLNFVVNFYNQKVLQKNGL
jgi:hypothetical protein